MKTVARLSKPVGGGLDESFLIFMLGGGFVPPFLICQPEPELIFQFLGQLVSLEAQLYIPENLVKSEYIKRKRGLPTMKLWITLPEKIAELKDQGTTDQMIQAFKRSRSYYCERNPDAEP